MNIKIIEPSFEIKTPLRWIKEYPKLIEEFGKTCYKSDISSSPNKFIKRIIKNKHLSVIEHLSITVKIVCSRSCSQQIVRHRLGSFSQESQRYVNYKKRGYEIICPENIKDPQEVQHKRFSEKLKRVGTIQGAADCFYTDFVKDWKNSIEQSIKKYENLLIEGFKPEDARSVLPNAMATTIITTFNLREWRHVFEVRALNINAQKEIRFIMRAISKRFAELLPDFFEDQLNNIENK